MQTNMNDGEALVTRVAVYVCVNRCIAWPAWPHDLHYWAERKYKPLAPEPPMPQKYRRSETLRLLYHNLGPMKNRITASPQTWRPSPGLRLRWSAERV